MTREGLIHKNCSTHQNFRTHRSCWHRGAFLIDSQVTNVEYLAFKDFKMALRSVAEEGGEDYSDDDELADNEREEQDDDTFSSQLSAVSSVDDTSCSISDLKTKSAIAPASPSHSSHASLFRAWTFCLARMMKYQSFLSSCLILLHPQLPPSEAFRNFHHIWFTCSAPLEYPLHFLPSLMLLF